MEDRLPAPSETSPPEGFDTRAAIAELLARTLPPPAQSAPLHSPPPQSPSRSSAPREPVHLLPASPLVSTSTSPASSSPLGRRGRGVMRGALVAAACGVLTAAVLAGPGVPTASDTLATQLQPAREPSRADLPASLEPDERALLRARAAAHRQIVEPAPRTSERAARLRPAPRSSPSPPPLVSPATLARRSSDREVIDEAIALAARGGSQALASRVRAVLLSTAQSQPRLIDEVRASFSRRQQPRALAVVACESNFDPRAVGGPNTDGTSDWGLFQLNDGGTLQELLVLMGEDPADRTRVLDPSWASGAARALFDRRGWQPWTCARLLGIYVPPPGPPGPPRPRATTSPTSTSSSRPTPSSSPSGPEASPQPSPEPSPEPSAPPAEPDPSPSPS